MDWKASLLFCNCDCWYDGISDFYWYLDQCLCWPGLALLGELLWKLPWKLMMACLTHELHQMPLQCHLHIATFIQ